MVLPGTAKQAVSKAVKKATPKQVPQKAKQLPQKAKQVPQKARQVGRAAQQAAPDGFKGALKDQDTLANLGAGALVGLVVLIAASVTSGSESTVAPFSSVLVSSAKPAAASEYEYCQSEQCVDVRALTSAPLRLFCCEVWVLQMHRK